MNEDPQDLKPVVPPALPGAKPRPAKPRLESFIGAPKEPLPPTWRPPPAPLRLRTAAPAAAEKKPQSPLPESAPLTAPRAAPAVVGAGPAGRAVVSQALATALEDLPELSAAATVAASREAKQRIAREQSWSVSAPLADSWRNLRDTSRRLGGWWEDWRTTSSFRVFLAYVAVYALLAFFRAPSEVVIEKSRREQEAAFLQDFLKAYGAAGGAVQTMRPSGGAEIYPRAVELRDEVLEAFRQAPVGGVFTCTITGGRWNPLLAFQGFTPIYAGGKYFNLEKKYDLTRFRYTLLLRKDSEKTGAIVLASVEASR